MTQQPDQPAGQPAPLNLPPFDQTNPFLQPQPGHMSVYLVRNPGQSYGCLTIRTAGGESTLFETDPDVLDGYAKRIAKMAADLRGTPAAANLLVAPANVGLPSLAALGLQGGGRS